MYFYGGVLGVFNTMRYQFLTKIYVCRVSVSGCEGACGCRYESFSFIFAIIYDGSKESLLYIFRRSRREIGCEESVYEESVAEISVWGE